MLRGFLVIFILCGIAILAVFGFRGQKSTAPPTEVFPDMVRQMKVRAQAPLGLFADGRGPRLPVAGTVPIGYEMPKPGVVAGSTDASLPGSATPATGTWSHPNIGFSEGTDYYNTGKMGDHWGTGIPVPVSRELMERGQQRFNITCAMCHGATAAGNGITKQYGLATVVTLQDERIRKMSDGEIFNTITNGKNTMMAYGPNIIVPDRWAIIAYCARYSAAKTQRRPMFLRTGAQNWRNNERAFPHCSNTGRRIFREQPLCRPLIAPGIDCHCGAGALRRGRISKSAPIQLFVALCFCIFFTLCAGCFSGRLCITPRTPTGRWLCGASWKTLRCYWWCWRFFLCRSFFCGAICIPGWTSARCRTCA